MLSLVLAARFWTSCCLTALSSRSWSIAAFSSSAVVSWSLIVFWRFSHFSSIVLSYWEIFATLSALLRNSERSLDDSKVSNADVPPFSYIYWMRSFISSYCLFNAFLAFFNSVWSCFSSFSFSPACMLSSEIALVRSSYCVFKSDR